MYLTIVFLSKANILILDLENKCFLTYNRLYFSCVTFVLFCYYPNKKVFSKE